MGYEVHITRADDWASNEHCPIQPSEWLDVIESDESLRLDGYNGPYFTIWSGDPDDPEAWLDLVDGNIRTKHPSERLLRKMVEIAGRLGAVVQGDDGELYDGSTSTVETQVSSPLLSFSRISLVLSFAAVTAIIVAISLDRSIRPEYPVGTAMPVSYALLMAGLVAIFGLSCVASSVFAAAALWFREDPIWYALAALVINGATVGYLVIAG